ncbi:hypothetical protein [Yinghuangia sp. YIM S09857]|uniref:hypothetical protein n=1 Tax=Yinghuangia sp. YIM S09857 TaxID=3436929 RepID=UPI003F53DBC1
MPNTNMPAEKGVASVRDTERAVNKMADRSPADRAGMASGLGSDIKSGAKVDARIEAGNNSSPSLEVKEEL